MDHVEHIVQGSDAHQAGDLPSAIEHFKAAWEIAPKFAPSIYYYANALFLNDENQAAKDILEPLLEMSEQEVAVHGGNNEAIVGYQIDGFYLMFHIMLYLTEDWKASSKFARLHLEKRKPGIESTWTKKAVQKELRELEQEWKEDE